MTSIVPPKGDRKVRLPRAPERRVQPDNSFVPFDKAAVEQSIPARFAAQMRCHAHRLAVKTPNKVLTYTQLNAASDQVVAAILAACGCGEESIGLLFERSASLVVALLASLKAAKICVPLDPIAPRARVRALLEDAQVRLLLTDRPNREQGFAAAEGLCSSLDIEDIEPFPEQVRTPLTPSADSLACIAYTSGSTGLPKGVAHTHRTLLHQAMVYTNDHHMAAEDRLAFVASPGALFTMWCILTAVLNGASVFPLDPQREPVVQLLHWIAQEEITVLKGGSAIVRGLSCTPGRDAPMFPKLRLVSFGGEAIYRSDVEICRRVFPGAIIAVGLGATEAGAMARYFLGKDTSIAGHVVPVGYPAEDKEILLLGEDGQDIGVDAVGEIAVRSRYLSPGYWRRPDLTAAVFQSDPAGGRERIYRTGDLGRRRPDGCLVHLGRKDFQVKIRGFRIEVAEIEGALLSLPNVQEAVVVAREDRPGDRRLVAYLVPRTHPAPTVSALRQVLAAALPDYMLPAAFVVLDALPKTSGGKLDRRALPAPSRARPGLDQPLVPPRSPVEATVCAIWAEVLGVDEVGIHDPFLDIGGHSLAASQVLARVSDTFHVDLPLRTLFEAPTVAELAAAIADRLAQGGEHPAQEQLLTELERLSEAEAERLLTHLLHEKCEDSHG